MDDEGIDQAIYRLSWRLNQAGHRCSPRELVRQQGTIGLPFDNGDRIVFKPGERGVEVWVSRRNHAMQTNLKVACVTVLNNACPDYLVDSIERLYLGSPLD
jgi:hypothetical protein